MIGRVSFAEHIVISRIVGYLTNAFTVVWISKVHFLIQVCITFSQQNTATDSVHRPRFSAAWQQTMVFIRYYSIRSAESLTTFKNWLKTCLFRENLNICCQPNVIPISSLSTNDLFCCEVFLCFCILHLLNFLWYPLLHDIVCIELQTPGFIHCSFVNSPPKNYRALISGQSSEAQPNSICP